MVSYVLAVSSWVSIPAEIDHLLNFVIQFTSVSASAAVGLLLF